MCCVRVSARHVEAGSEIASPTAHGRSLVHTADAVRAALVRCVCVCARAQVEAGIAITSGALLTALYTQLAWCAQMVHCVCVCACARVRRWRQA